MEIPVSHAPVDRVTTFWFQDYPVLVVGRFTYLHGRSLIQFQNVLSPVRIGHFCSVANGASFFLRTDHHQDWVTTYPVHIMPWPPDVPKPVAAHDHHKGDIAVGSDVWIGEGARLMPGVTVGHGAIIGAGAVVTHDVPAYALVAGNPARVKKARFAEREIEILLRLQWWEWPTEKIRRFAPLICSRDIEGLRTHSEP